MDIGSILQFIIGAAVALALGWLGWQEWNSASYEKKLATVKRVVFSVEEYAKVSGIRGADKLAGVMARLAELLPNEDPKELDETVHAEVAKLNAAQQAGPAALGRGYWID